MSHRADLEIDLVVLSRTAKPLSAAVHRGITAQVCEGLVLHLIQIVGTVHSGETHRWQTIARARNEGFAQSSENLIMFLDDDVVLGPDCVNRLVSSLRERSELAAVAADYLKESTAQGAWGRPDRHIVMGATLFRRKTLSLIRFRSEPEKCECQCCCDDLRRLGLAIAYEPTAKAWHEQSGQDPHLHDQSTGSPTGNKESNEQAGQGFGVAENQGQDRPSMVLGRVLAAFDRRHFERFRRQFLGSLRAAGNDEPVTAVGYGLYPSEQRILSQAPGVELIVRPATGVKERPPIRRLRDFAEIVSHWPATTPGAYWDAGDVIFQSRLERLWSLVRAHPGKLLAVREPVSFPGNPAVRAWTSSINDLKARRRAFALLSSRPFLNSGFAAGTAQALLKYFREADRLIHSSDLTGSSDWGDQTALNLYCHSERERWREIDEAWNYCVHDRQPREVRVCSDGQVVTNSGEPIHIVHGNAFSLPQFVISREFG